MSGLYGLALKLYPRQYRSVFEAEMLDVHAQAMAGQKERGVFYALAFGLLELSGIVIGAFRERMKIGDVPYGYEVCAAEPATRGEAERRIASLIRGMEYAIAHHDFPSARRFSFEERALRDWLDG